MPLGRTIGIAIEFNGCDNERWVHGYNAGFYVYSCLAHACRPCALPPTQRPAASAPIATFRHVGSLYDILDSSGQHADEWCSTRQVNSQSLNRRKALQHCRPRRLGGDRALDIALDSLAGWSVTTQPCAGLDRSWWFGICTPWPPAAEHGARSA